MCVDYTNFILNSNVKCNKVHKILLVPLKRYEQQHCLPYNWYFNKQNTLRYKDKYNKIVDNVFCIEIIFNKSLTDFEHYS